MSIQGNESGLALIVTLLLGLIAAGFIGAMMYVLSSGIRVSGIESRYTAALEAGKGGVSYIKDNLSSANLVCTDGNGNSCICSEIYEGNPGEGSTIKCGTNSSMSFHKNATVNMGSVSLLGDYNVNATLISKSRTNDGGSVLSFVVSAQSTKDTSEKSEIEFVYKLD